MAYENTALGSKVTQFLTFSFFFFTYPSVISGSEVCGDCIKTMIENVARSSFVHNVSKREFCIKSKDLDMLSKVGLRLSGSFY